MSKEYIWGCELSSSNPVYIWNMEDESDCEDGNALCYNLLLRQAVLGTKAAEGEVNVIALETAGALANPIEQPLLRLKAGHVEQCELDLLITHPGSRLRLVEGSGPVYLWGQHLVDVETDNDFAIENDNSEHSEDDMDERELQEELEFLEENNEKHADEPLEKSKKRRKTAKQDRAKKLAKLECTPGRITTDQDREPSNENFEDDDEDKEEKEKSAPVAKSRSSKSNSRAAKSPKEKTRL